MGLNSNDFLTVSELAEDQGVDRKTVYRWLKGGAAPKHERLCGRYYFYRDALLTWKRPARGRNARVAR